MLPEPSIKVVLPETNLEGARLMGERLRTKIEDAQLRSQDDIPFGVTISVGIATWDAAYGSNSKDGLIAAADRAMYQAKNRGRNIVATLEPA